MGLHLLCRRTEHNVDLRGERGDSQLVVVERIVWSLVIKRSIVWSRSHIG